APRPPPPDAPAPPPRHLSPRAVLPPPVRWISGPPTRPPLPCRASAAVRTRLERRLASAWRFPSSRLMEPILHPMPYPYTRQWGRSTPQAPTAPKAAGVSPRGHAIGCATQRGPPLAVTGKPVTAEGVLRMPQEGLRHELIYGELRTMTPTGSEHGRRTNIVNWSLEQYVRAHGAGAAFAAETGFLLARDPDLVRAPDAAFVRPERVVATGQVPTYWP